MSENSISVQSVPEQLLAMGHSGIKTAISNLIVIDFCKLHLVHNKIYSFLHLFNISPTYKLTYSGTKSVPSSWTPVTSGLEVVIDTGSRLNARHRYNTRHSIERSEMSYFFEKPKARIVPSTAIVFDCWRTLFLGIKFSLSMKKNRDLYLDFSNCLNEVSNN